MLLDNYGHQHIATRQGSRPLPIEVAESRTLTMRLQKVRGTRQMHELLREEGGTVGAGEMGWLLGGISAQAADKRRRKGKLIALPVGKGGYRYTEPPGGRGDLWSRSSGGEEVRHKMYRTCCEVIQVGETQSEIR